MRHQVEKSVNNKNVLLIIEDNPLLVGMYKTAFERQNINVLVAHDGMAGIELAREKRPDVILLDLLMPGIDGYEVLKILKADPNTKSIKIIILTVIAKKENAEIAKKLGAVDYIVKTELKLQEIVDRVMSLFDFI